MSEEIKEILDNMKEWSVDGVLWFEINDEKAKLLYDYITNLQEENRTLKEFNVCVGCNNNPDYETRINKAIEYIEIIQYNESYGVKEKDYLKLLDILKGG